MLYAWTEFHWVNIWRFLNNSGGCKNSLNICKSLMWRCWRNHSTVHSLRLSFTKWKIPNMLIEKITIQHRSDNVNNELTYCVNSKLAKDTLRYFDPFCGSMKFWGGSGSGSADPCLWLVDPDSDSDPDPGSGSFYFRRWPSRCQQKTNFLTQVFLLMTFWSYFYIIFLNIKIHKESQNSRNQGFSYCFCMMIEGSGSIPLTSGSGSGSWRPKNMWIRWIRIRIRIRNTVLKTTHCLREPRQTKKANFS